MLTTHQRRWAHAAVGFSTQWFLQQLSHLSSLAEFNERALETEQAELEEWLAARDAGLNTEDSDGQFLYLDDATELEHKFPVLVRAALIVAIVSLFEAFLARQSRAAASWSGCAQDAIGRGVGRHLDFLEERARIRLPKQSAYWQPMKTIETLRHAIVHDEGRLPEGDPAFRRALEREGFAIAERDYILVPRAAIGWVAETLGTLATEIDSAIRRTIEGSE